MMLIVCLVPALLAVSHASTCSQLLQCQDVIPGEGFAQQSNLAALANDAEIMDAVCGELDHYVECVEANMDGCNEDTALSEAKATQDIVEYLCTAEGRAQVLAVGNSECAHNPMFENRFNIALESCMQTFQFELQMMTFNAALEGNQPDMADFCPHIGRLKTCMVRDATSMCGSDMGTFLSSIWDIAAGDQFATFGCDADPTAAHRYVKRALPMVMSHASLINKLRK